MQDDGGRSADSAAQRSQLIEERVAIRTNIFPILDKFDAGHGAFLS